jgi:hypothetical protein
LEKMQRLHQQDGLELANTNSTVEEYAVHAGGKGQTRA